MKLRKYLRNGIFGLACGFIGLSFSACEEHTIPEEATDYSHIFGDVTTHVRITRATISFTITDLHVGSAEEFVFQYCLGDNLYDEFGNVNKENCTEIPIPLSSLAVGETIDVELENLTPGTEYYFSLIARRGVSESSADLISHSRFTTYRIEDLYEKAYWFGCNWEQVDSNSARIGIGLWPSREFPFIIHEIGFLWSTNRKEIEEKRGKKEVISSDVVLSDTELTEYFLTLSNLQPGTQYYLVPYTVIDTESENSTERYYTSYGDIREFTIDPEWKEEDGVR